MFGWGWWLMVCLVFSGCGPREEITETIVPRARAGLPPPTLLSGSMPQVAIQGPRRMVVAMVERPTKAWFFRIDDSDKLVTQSELEWKPFLQSLRFSEVDEPQWELPDGWQALPSRPGRFATIAIPSGEQTLELAISSLPPGQSVVANVNRWRGQLGLNEIKAEELPDRLRQLSFSGGDFLVFDETVSGAPEDDSPVANTVSASAMPKFEVPVGWRFQQANQFVAATYLKEFEGGTAQIAVSRMPALAVSWETVLAMWIEQVELPRDSLHDWLARTDETSVNGQPARRVELVSGDDAAMLVLIGVRVEWGTDAWYFKLSGDPSAVSAARDEFNALLGSVKMERGE
ncbi:MAG TPA: hypothetical protein PKD54_14485 [Pirellulaceae bacterium]|nr:hypothetical protein [Pirellulaceae bacterium]